MNVKIKLVDGGTLPQKKTTGAACYDCYARLDNTIGVNETISIPLGFCVEVPEGYYMEVRGRSGLSLKGLLVMTGTVDADYRGEVGAIVTNLTGSPFTFSKGFRVAQVMIKPVIDTEFEEVLLLSETKRGNNGFGSTGTL